MPKKNNNALRGMVAEDEVAEKIYEDDDTELLSLGETARERAMTKAKKRGVTDKEELFSIGEEAYNKAIKNTLSVGY